MWMSMAITMVVLTGLYPLMAVPLFRRLQPRVRRLIGPLLEELQDGLPQYLVEAAPDDQVIHIKHAFVSWTVEARQQYGGGMFIQLSPELETDRDGRVIEQGPPLRCRVRSRRDARRVGRHLALIVQASNATASPIMRFVPCPQYS